MKRLASIGLRVVGVALVFFILWSVDYRDHYVDDAGVERSGRVVEEDGRRFFRESDGGRLHPLPPEVENSDRYRQGLFRIVEASKKLLLLLFVLYYGPVTLLSIVRWWYLLKCVGIPISFREAFRLTFIGFFFNSAVPGLTGGDLVKGVYIARANPGQRVKAFMSVLVDRVIGLFALGLLSGLVLLFHLSDERFHGPAAVVFLFLGISFAFGAVFLSGRLRRLLRLESLIRKLPFSQAWVEIDQAIFIYRRYPKAVVGGILLSLLNHFALVVMAIGMGRAIGIDIPAVQFFMLVPVCMMMAAIPLLPGGWGLRELGFKGFFAIVGVAATQAVALSIIIGLTQLFWSLLGGVFFLLSPDRVSSREVESFTKGIDDEIDSETGS